MHFLIFFLFCTSLFSAPKDPFVLAATEGEPSLIISDSVSALTGDFVVSEADYVVPALEPIVLRRTYMSGDGHGENGGWEFFPHLHLTLHQRKAFPEKHYGEKYRYAVVAEPSGTRIRYTFQKPKENQPDRFLIEFEEDGKGITNTSQGTISGRTNIKNNLLIVEDTRTFILYSGDGRKRCYKRLGKRNRYTPKPCSCLLDYERLPNQNLIRYEYDEYHRVQTIKTFNPDGTKNYAWVKFQYAGDPEKIRDFDIETSNGKQLHYRFEKRGKKDEAHFYLTSVTSNFFPEENTLYSDTNKLTGPLITRRILPDQRYLKAEYYVLNHNNVGGANVNISSLEHPSLDRVKMLYAPVGHNHEEIPINRFFYHLHREKTKGRKYEYKDNGITRVYDAYNNLNQIKYSQRFYPLELTYHQGSQLNHSLHMAWTDKGELKSSCFHNKHDKLLWGRSFEYDARGNVTKETFVNATTHFQHNDANLITRIEEPSGLVTHFSYLHDTPLITSKLTGEANRIFKREFCEYNEDNLLIEEISDNGSSTGKNDLSNVTVRKIKRILTRQEQPALGFPEWIEEKYWEKGEEHLLKKIFIVYSSDNRIVRQDVYDANGIFYYSLKTDYDAMGRPIEETDALGKVTRTTYDRHGNKTSVEEPRKTTYFGYDYANRHTSTDERGFDQLRHDTQFRYNYTGDQTATLDYLGHETTYNYDAFHHQTAIRAPDGSTIKKTYDPSGRETSITDQKGNRTSRHFNHFGSPKHITHPDGGKEIFLYHPSGTLKESIDPHGTKTTYAYEVFGRVTLKQVFSKEETLILQEAFTYDGFNLLTKTDAEGNLTEYQYDGAGRKISELFYNGKHQERTTFGYDTLGRPSKIQIGDVVKITEYDLLDRPIEEREEDIRGTVVTRVLFGYDSAGNQNSLTRFTAEGEATSATLFDSFNRPIQIVDPLGHKTRIFYNERFTNSQGQRVLQKTTIDPMGIQTLETCDTCGRLASTEKKNTLNDSLSLEEYQYDPAGNLTLQLSTIISPDGSQRQSTTHWQYGPLKRLISVTESSDTENAKTTHFVYNRKGEREEVIKPDGVKITTLYDPLGRVKELFSSDGSVHYRYTYNRLHHLLDSEDVTTGVHITRSYDAKGRLQEETLPSGTLKNSYDAQGRREKQLLPDHSRIAFHYDAAHLKTVERQTASGEPLYSHHYTEYDPSGFLLKSQLIGNLGTLSFKIDKLGRNTAIQCPYRKEVIEEFDPNGNILQRILNRKRESYRYDALNQLISDKTHTYQYDSHFNRLQKDDDSYQIDSLNRIHSTKNNTYTYDRNGNLLTKQSSLDFVQYTYDALDRLIAIEEPHHTRYTYIYDSFHRRLSKTVYKWRRHQWVHQTTQYFLYDGENEIGSTDTQGTIHELRILGQGRGAEISAAIAIELDNEVYAPIHDLCGNVTELISLKTSQIAQSYTYTAFGEENITSLSTPSIENPWRFSSKRTEERFQLVFFGRRYYQPHLGRWLNPDPDGFTDSLNLYAYLLNAPLTHLDLYGLAEEALNSIHYAQVADKKSLAGMSRAVAGFLLNNPRFQGTVQALGGLAETSLGGSMIFATQGAAAPFGWPIMAHGLDQFLTGARTAFTGRPKETLTFQLLKETGMPDQMASIADGGLSIFGTMGATAAITRMGKAVFFVDQQVSLSKSQTLAISNAHLNESGSIAGRLGWEIKYPHFQNATRHTTATIQNRLYSGHALDQMQNRGFFPSVVENTINNGKIFPTTSGTIGYYDTVNNVRVIVNSSSGKVVTVIPGAPK